MLEKILQYDREFLIRINQWGSGGQDIFWVGVTNTLFWMPFFVWILYFNFKKFERKTAYLNLLYTALTIATTLILTHFSKILTMRLRPINDPDIMQHLRALITANQYSFFSGHASNSFSVTTILYLIFRKKLRWALLMFAWPVLYSFSRLYLGVHFPTDVLVGTTVGIGTALIFYHYYKRKISIIEIKNLQKQ